jgi:uncharacterized membrane protein (UPF0136 family)
MRANYVLWIYIALLVAGGLMGFFKAGSRVSLIASLVSAAILSLAATGVLFPAAIDLVLAVLLVLFGIRLSKTRKFMPSGLMLVLTAMTMVLRRL